MRKRPQRTCSRRTLLKTGTGAAVTLAATSGTALAQDENYDGYLADAMNYDGRTADYTGQDSVTVKVGAGSVNLAFGPAAITVDPGTEVTWEWTGAGGAHNVVAEDGSFRSGDAVSTDGETFTQTFESEGVNKYYCNPHKASGMRGVVAVGDTAEGEVVAPGQLQSDDGGSESTGESADYDFDGYLDDANLYEGSVEDLRGEDAVTVEVGAGSIGLAFGPPAIHVDPGTTVTWEWTGEGGGHNVVANTGAFESGEPQTSGTYEYTFEEDATHTYYCRPHEGAGMKGAVVVGAGGSAGEEESSGPQTAANDLALQTLAAMLVMGLLSPIIFLLFVRRKMQGEPRPE
ncbi:halocyanin domain-containing protein [Salinibaculum rarum]|uniref:halocyanin domain-containing protein n=1 Tax=Salinibaculum rarum TaxID=3058903 RepID=UPI00265DDEA0|nr:halocyanin domain-containing protein [Salinibaculum sp. KK48]